MCSLEDKLLKTDHCNMYMKFHVEGTQLLKIFLKRYLAHNQFDFTLPKYSHFRNCQRPLPFLKIP